MSGRCFCTASRAVLPLVHGYALAELYPNLVRYGPGAGLDAMERRFGYALDRIIEGIKLRAQASASSSKRRRASSPAG